MGSVLPSPEPSGIRHKLPILIVAGVSVLTLDALVILAYTLHAVYALFEYLTNT